MASPSLLPPPTLDRVPSPSLMLADATPHPNPTFRSCGPESQAGLGGQGARYQGGGGHPGLARAAAHPPSCRRVAVLLDAPGLTVPVLALCKGGGHGHT